MIRLNHQLMSIFFGLLFSGLPALAGSGEECIQERNPLGGAILNLKGALKSTELQACSELKGKRKVPLELQCRSGSGAVFERVEGGWKDLGASGLVWLDPIVTRINQEKARIHCEEKVKGAALPTQKELELAKSRGVFELIQNEDRRGYQFWFWTSTLKEGDPKFAYMIKDSAKEASAEFRFLEESDFAAAVCIRR
jgi:hypothetical protein